MVNPLYDEGLKTSSTKYANCYFLMIDVSNSLASSYSISSVSKVQHNYELKCLSFNKNNDSTNFKFQMLIKIYFS